MDISIAMTLHQIEYYNDPQKYKSDRGGQLIQVLKNDDTPLNINFGDIQKNTYIQKDIYNEDKEIYCYAYEDIPIGYAGLRDYNNITTTLIDLSTINFQAQALSKHSIHMHDLEAFSTYQKIYKQSCLQLGQKYGKNPYIPWLWSYIFIDIIQVCKEKGYKFLERRAVSTSKNFYTKICQKLVEEKIILNFDYDKNNDFTIYLQNKE